MDAEDVPRREEAEVAGAEEGWSFDAAEAATVTEEADPGEEALEAWAEAAAWGACMC